MQCGSAANRAGQELQWAVPSAGAMVSKVSGGGGGGRWQRRHRSHGRRGSKVRIEEEEEGAQGRWGSKVRIEEEEEGARVAGEQGQNRGGGSRPRRRTSGRPCISSTWSLG